MPKITELTADSTPTGDDLVVTVHDPGGSPVNRKVTLNDLATGLATLAGMLNAFVANSGDETIAGVKTFSSVPLVPDLAYDASTWNGSTATPTRNAVRDVIESFVELTSEDTSVLTINPTTGVVTITSGIARKAMSSGALASQYDHPQSNTTPADIGIGIANIPIGRYFCFTHIPYLADGGADIKVGYRLVSGTATLTWTTQGLSTGAVTGGIQQTIHKHKAAITSVEGLGGQGVTGTDQLVVQNMGILVVSSAAEVRVQAAQNTSHASTVSVLVGAELVLIPLIVG